MKMRLTATALFCVAAAFSGCLAAPEVALRPGATFTVSFPDMPPTFFAVFEQKSVPAQMTVFLPKNYDPGRPFPLFVFLNGWDGGPGGNPGVAREICQDQDFVCVSVPLFKAAGYQVAQPNVIGPDFIITEPDGRAMWPHFKTMLAKLEELVPNIAPERRVLGGFSNGAHMTAALLDGSDGEVSDRFSAFLFGEGGGKLQHYERLKGKPFLMVSSNAKSLPRATEVADAARAAGADATLIFEDIGKHGLPTAAYPRIRAWLAQAVGM